MKVLHGIGQLNEVVRDLHGPTESVAATLSQLVPVPQEIASVPDADLLDLSVAVTTHACAGHDTTLDRSTCDDLSDQGLASVQVRARYATNARVSQIKTFYREQFERAGASFTGPSLGADDVVEISAVLRDHKRTTFKVSIHRERGYRSVKIRVAYDGFDYREIFERFARWHDGNAPVVDMTRPVAVEVSTFTSGRGPSTLVLYSTEYETPQVSRRDQRTVVDLRMDELGWSYTEPRDGMMFIRDGSFDAEAHLRGDDHQSSVTFVGEFTLRS